METTSRRLLLCLLLATISGLGCPLAGAAEPLTHRSPSGVEFTVTADGLARIRVGERVVAEGGWYAWNAGPHWFGWGGRDGVLAYGGYSQGLYAQAAADVAEKSLDILAPDHARVRHAQPDAVATYDYRFDGEDATITARLENKHAGATLAIPAVGGLRFCFQAEPQGEMRVWHTSYLQAVRTGAFHPSHLNKIGGSYAADGSVGIGCAPVLRGLEPTLFLWDYDLWNPDTPERRANRWLSHLRADPIPPGGALTFSMTLRVSPNTDWRHLLQPYKDRFLAAFGQTTYETDFRCVAVAHVNRNREAIGPDNPYGFHGGFRRLDKAEEVAHLCDLLIPGLKAANGHGLIFWGQGGQEPRGQMYRADFDVLPPEVKANWPVMAARFREAGLRLGVTTRPRHMHVRLDWENDGTIDLNPDDGQHLKLLGDRFQNMIDRGCTLFYLDSFGSSLADVKIMRYLRGRLGPSIQTFAEHACDVMAVYSAFYAETDFWARGSRDWVREDQWVPRTGLRFLEIVGWLLGPVPVVTRAYDVHGEIPEGFESAVEFFYRHGLSPMVEDYTLPGQAEELRRVQDRYVNEDGSLK